MKVILLVDFLYHGCNYIGKDSLCILIRTVRQFIKKLNSFQPSLVLVDEILFFRLRNMEVIVLFYLIFPLWQAVRTNSFINQLFIAKYYLITFHSFLYWYFLIVFILLPIKKLNLVSIFNIKQEIFLQCFNSKVFLIARYYMASFINFELKQIDPFYPFELIFYQHFIYQRFTLITYIVQFLRNPQLGIFYYVYKLGD